MRPEKQYRAVGVDRKSPSSTMVSRWVDTFDDLDALVNDFAGYEPAFDEIVTETRIALYSDPEPLVHGALTSRANNNKE